MRAAEKIVGVSLPSLQDIYSTRLTRKALSIAGDPTHPTQLLQSAAIREETAESPGEDQQTEGQLHPSGCQEAELPPVLAPPPPPPQQHRETIVHLFWHCYSKGCGKTSPFFVIENIDKGFSLLWENVLFGFVHSKKWIYRKMYCTFLISLLTKYCIHKCKFSCQKPLF